MIHIYLYIYISACHIWTLEWKKMTRMGPQKPNQKPPHKDDSGWYHNISKHILARFHEMMVTIIQKHGKTGFFWARPVACKCCWEIYGFPVVNACGVDKHRQPRHPQVLKCSCNSCKKENPMCLALKKNPGQWWLRWLFYCSHKHIIRLYM